MGGSQRAWSREHGAKSMEQRAWSRGRNDCQMPKTALFGKGIRVRRQAILFITGNFFPFGWLSDKRNYWFTVQQFNG
jgi:hypothetical protein